MTCFDLEILLAEYVDGTLPDEQRAAVEGHLSDCANCAALADDAAGAVAFIGRAAAIEPPPELVTRISHEIANHPGGSMFRKSSWAPHWFTKSWFGKWLEPVFEPRFAMGMAMTVLSFAMVGQLAGVQVRQWKASDLNPANVWMAAENRVQRTWERAVKNYESTRLVFEIEAQLNEWDQLQDRDENPSGGAAKGTEAR
jgi:anti-sigma factor RsiW